MSEHDTRTRATTPGHEPLAVSIKGIVLTTLGIVLLVAFAIAAMWPLARLLSPSGAPEEAAGLGVVPGEAPPITVGLNPNQSEDRLAHEETQRQWLREYAWLDDEQGVARIPVERAMQIFQEQGLQGVTGSTSSSAGPQSPSTPDEPSTAEGQASAPDEPPDDQQDIQEDTQ